MFDEYSGDGLKNPHPKPKHFGLEIETGKVYVNLNI